MENQNKGFWEEFYKTTNDNIIRQSSFAEFIYEDYIKIYNNDNIYLKIADLGCGNCRDTLFFNEKNNLCYGIDINGVLNRKQSNCLLLKQDVEHVLNNYELSTLLDMIYMRWFLHAIPYNISRNIFVNAVHNLKPNGIICVEVRSINDNELKKNSVYDENDKSYRTTHKRWLYSIDMCKQLAFNNNCDILYCQEGYFSPNTNTETNNPLLIRFICKKKLLPYYEQSKNYPLYKHILPDMKPTTIKCYQDLKKFNKVIEKHKIKYVAVAGTSLGLVRHGGIIPWDNDIDIGFIESEWDKLMSIQDTLIEEGLAIHVPPKNHIAFNKQVHFGLIDCFKLTKINDEFYKGVAETYCSIDEYNNVVKQMFGNTYIYAPFCNHKSLEKRYNKQYFKVGNVNDNFHFKDKSVKLFHLEHNDLSYQLE